MSEEFGKEFWEERYRGHTSLWSKRPNPQLVTEVDELPPGTALDVGCGEGADATWLASRGWRVTAVDIAGTALDRARSRAEALDHEIEKPIDWVEADLASWTPARGRYDLVSSHYVHPTMSRREFLERLTPAVAPGGTLLVVDHHPADERPSQLASTPDRTVTAEQITDGLDHERWNVTTAESRTRTITDHDGNEITLRDVILTARRLR